MLSIQITVDSITAFASCATLQQPLVRRLWVVSEGLM